MEACVLHVRTGPGLWTTGKRWERGEEGGDKARAGHWSGGTSQENDVDPGRYLSSAARCTVEIAPSSGPVSLYIDIRVSPLPPSPLCPCSIRLAYDERRPIVRCYLATTRYPRLWKECKKGRNTNSYIIKCWTVFVKFSLWENFLREFLSHDFRRNDLNSVTAFIIIRFPLRFYEIVHLSDPAK